MKKNETTTPFDFIKSVSYTKKYIFDDNIDYNSYVVNKGLSNYADCILYCNEVNLHHNISDKMNYDYYFNILRKKNRYSEWYKNNSKDKIEVIMKYYNCNPSVASQYLRCMSKEDYDYINNKVSNKK